MAWPAASADRARRSTPATRHHPTRQAARPRAPCSAGCVAPMRPGQLDSERPAVISTGLKLRKWRVRPGRGGKCNGAAFAQEPLAVYDGSITTQHAQRLAIDKSTDTGAVPHTQGDTVM